MTENDNNEIVSDNEINSSIDHIIKSSPDSYIEFDDGTVVELPKSDGAQKVGSTLYKAAKIMEGYAEEITSVSSDSLVAADSGGNQLVLDTERGVRNIRQGKPQSAIKREVEEATEEQRRRMIQYEEDKAFYEKQILQKARAASAINNDAIKILHPTYRTKLMEAISRYGTLQAALLELREKYGVAVRPDVLRRMRGIIPALDAEIEDALGMYQGRLQRAMHQRAVEGVDKIIRDKEGNEIDREKVYSDSLLAKMVDTHNPEYKEARQKDEKRGNTINVQIIKDFHNHRKD